jgi:hypothetical protein
LPALHSIEVEAAAARIDVSWTMRLDSMAVLAAAVDAGGDLSERAALEK